MKSKIDHEGKYLMKQPTHNYCWFGGNTETIDIRMLDENHSPEDLTGATAELGIKMKLDDPTYVYHATVNVQGDDNNEFLFIVPENITESLVPENSSQAYYQYALDILDNNLNNTTVLTGRIIIKKNVLS